MIIKTLVYFFFPPLKRYHRFTKSQSTKFLLGNGLHFGLGVINPFIGQLIETVK
ncbi:MAG: hypothetical protein AUK63_1909 [bacterium P3]|nr:MAG: hypothetical protein AUK63_1909 [bacterium P3]KWW35808.1 MAG: hypothetical protein F083_2403 [bacterium F083]